MAILDLFRNFADNVQGNVANLGSSPLAQRMGMAAPEDPSAIDPNTGMPAGMVHDANMQGLRNMSALFLAAGQSMSGADRAKILAQMGDATNPSKQLYNMAQARLMNQQVQDSLQTRQRREQAITSLRGMDLSSLDDRERMVFQSYLEAGDPAGATDFLAKMQTRNSQGMMLQDGSEVPRGVANTNIADYNRRWAPEVQTADTTLQIANEMLDLLDQGYVGGQFADYKIMADKLSRAAGGVEIDPNTLRTEQGRAAAMNLVIERMKDLGGNDSYEELKAMQSMFAGGSLEPETIRKNFERFARNKIRNVTIATEQQRRLRTGGQAEYNTPVEFKPDMIFPAYRGIWDRAETSAKENPTGKPAGSGKPVTTDWSKRFNY